MIEKIGEFYQTKKSGQRCPGESNCDRFKSAKGKTREEKEFNACVGPLSLPKPICQMYPTKPKTKSFANYQKNEKIIDRVFGIRRRRDSDKRFDLGFILPIEYELLMICDEIFENYERNLKLANVEVFESLIQIMAKTQM